MTAAILTLVIFPLVSYQPARDNGEICGVVLNATQNGMPAGDVEVVLRARLNGRLVPVAQTTADSQGRFRFEDLPVGGDFLYLPGANRGGIHYPGSRVLLTPYQNQARVELQVHETQSHPNPLVARRHVIRIQPEPGALRVTESILISNPTSKTYVGRAPGADAEPVTLSLAIPPNFERTTFHKEFFGRRFSFSGQKLITGIPWTPGERELAFTYVVPNETRHVQLRRPLDLPCSDVQVHLSSERPEEVRCSLRKANDSENSGGLCFASRGELEPGHVIRVEFGHAPVPWSSYAKWIAASLLAGLVAVTSILMLRRSKRRAQPTAPPPAHHTSPHPGRSQKHARRRTSRRRHKHSVSR